MTVSAAAEPDRGAGSGEEASAPKLSDIPLFADLDTATLAAIEEELQWITLRGGFALFREGEPSDALYIVTSGSLAVIVEESGAEPRVVARIGRGETVGEMGVITGAPRSATIVAVRDTELLVLTRSGFEGLLARHPKLTRHLLGLMVHRLQQTTHNVAVPRLPKTIAIVPLAEGLPCAAFTRGLAAALEASRKRVRVLGLAAADRASSWFHSVESAHDLVLYEAGADASPWTRFCLRQADRALLLIGADGTPTHPLAAALAWRDAHRGSADIVVLHERVRNGGAEWGRLDGVPIDLHHHIRLDRAPDLARLARLLTGSAVGLVLSGGAARGFAHLGVVKALRRSGIPIDLVGGASMGSIVAAAVALEWGEEEMHERLHRAFVASNPVNDYTLPLLALVRGAKVTARLREHFGEVLIENLWRPYFCVSSNLTAGRSSAHVTGPLWRAVRASIAIPGILPPVIAEGEVLVDGGVMNNFPVDVMSNLRRGPIIGSDVATKAAPTMTAENLGDGTLRWLFRNKLKKPPGIVSLLMRSGTVSSDAQTHLFRNRVDLLLEPPIEAIDLLDWQAFDRAIELGYRHTMEVIERQGGSFRAAEAATAPI